METLTLNQTIAVLESLVAEHGDIPLVLYDLDTGWHFTLTEDNFEAQDASDGRVRIALGPSSYQDQCEDDAGW